MFVGNVHCMYTVIGTPGNRQVAYTSRQNCVASHISLPVVCVLVYSVCWALASLTTDSSHFVILCDMFRLIRFKLSRAELWTGDRSTAGEIARSSKLVKEELQG
jgi:hypothetical protein